METSQFLDRSMPAPTLLACVTATMLATHPWRVGVLSVLLVASNIVLNQVIAARVRDGKSLGGLVDRARASISLVLLPPMIAWGGANAPAWLPVAPAIAAMAALMDVRSGWIASALLILSSAVAWALVGATAIDIAVMVVALTSFGLVTLPLIQTLRRRHEGLHTLTEELEARNRDLEVAKLTAEAATRAKSEFLAHMSHEIRTPMNGVLGCLQLIEPDVDDRPEARALLTTASNSAHALLQIINDILDVSKIEARKMTIERVPTDVAELLADIVRVHQPLVGSEVELTLDLDPSVSWAETDPVRLRQIVTNLVANAIKFTRKGSVEVRAVLLGTSTLRIQVADTGVGISKEAARRLFEPFVQADDSTTRRYGGTGLGLTLVKQLATMLGGEASLESELRVGTTFTVTTRWIPVDGPRTEDEVSSDRGRQPGGLRVLLAEDNPVNRMVAQRLIQRMGHAVTMAANGHEVLARMAEEPRPDVILMDCHMPELDGFEATRRLRAQGEHIPIIALTASAMSEERERCFATGMDAFVSKPIEVGQLAETLDEVCEWLEPRSDAA